MQLVLPLVCFPAGGDVLALALVLVLLSVIFVLLVALIFSGGGGAAPGGGRSGGGRCCCGSGGRGGGRLQLHIYLHLAGDLVAVVTGLSGVVVLEVAGPQASVLGTDIGNDEPAFRLVVVPDASEIGR